MRRGFPVLQDGDDGRTIGFQLDQFDEIAAVMKPHRRLRLSADQRQRARERILLVRSRLENPVKVADYSAENRD